MTDPNQTARMHAAIKQLDPDGGWDHEKPPAHYVAWLMERCGLDLEDATAVAALRKAHGKARGRTVMSGLKPKTVIRPTIPELERELDKARKLASHDAAGSHSCAPNSYVAGYSAGYHAAFVWALEYLRGELS